MDMNFSINGQLDPVATYAAILSTAIAVWEFVKWRSRHSVTLTITPNMEYIPSDGKTYIIAKVVNTGETKTTITHFHGYHWGNRWEKFRRKNTKAFLVPNNTVTKIPAILEPGEQWLGSMIQNKEIEEISKNRCLYIGISHSLGKKEIMQRVIVRNVATASKAKEAK